MAEINLRETRNLPSLPIVQYDERNALRYFMACVHEPCGLTVPRSPSIRGLSLPVKSICTVLAPTLFIVTRQYSAPMLKYTARSGGSRVGPIPVHAVFIQVRIRSAQTLTLDKHNYGGVTSRTFAFSCSAVLRLSQPRRRRDFCTRRGRWGCVGNSG